MLSWPRSSRIEPSFLLRAAGRVAILVLLVATAPGAAGAQSSTIIWAVSGGGANSDIGFAVATDPAGGAVLVGRIADAVTLADPAPIPPGDLDAVIAKFGSDGRLQWMRRSGGANRDSAQAVATDRGRNVLVAGFFRDTGDFGGTKSDSAGHRDAFIAKYGPAGDVVWLRRAGGPLIDEGRGIATDREGNVLVTGGFEGEASFAADTTLKALGDGDVFIAKYDPDGTLLWVKQAGGSEHAWGNAVAADSAGNVLVAGAFSDKAAFGDVTLTAARDLGIFIAKYSPDGNLLWARAIDGTGRDIAYSLAVDADDTFVVAGVFARTLQFGETRLESAGGKDGFIARYGPDGTPLWARAMGGDGDDTARAIAIGEDGLLLVAGSFQRRIAIGETSISSAGDSDVLVAAFAPDGEPLWARSAGGAQADMAFGIAAEAQGAVYVTGSFTGTAMFDQVPLRSAGSDDLFLAKLKYGPR